MSSKKNKEIKFLEGMNDWSKDFEYGKNRRWANSARLHRERLIKRKRNVRGAK